MLYKMQDSPRNNATRTPILGTDPNCCTKCKIIIGMAPLGPRLLYKMQHFRLTELSLTQIVVFSARFPSCGRLPIAIVVFRARFVSIGHLLQYLHPTHDIIHKVTL